MDALAAYGSDSDASDEIQPSEEQQESKTDASVQAPAESCTYPIETSQKRKRSDAEEAAANTATKQLLPPPPISNGNSMIHWNEDYLSQSASKSATKRIIQSERLEQIRSKLTTNTSWASQLKNQHDFHNPNLFQGVVQLFDIQEPLGTNLKCSDELQDWEYGVVDMEEKARIQQQSQFQAEAPSQFAQQQLAQAMQQQRR